MALAKGLVEPVLCALIDAEAQGREFDWPPFRKYYRQLTYAFPSAAATLFRLNTPLTRCMEYVVRAYALEYVRETIGKDIAKICSAGPIVGTDEEVQQVLRYKASHLWNKLYSESASS